LYAVCFYADGARVDTQARQCLRRGTTSRRLVATGSTMSCPAPDRDVDVVSEVSVGEAALRLVLPEPGWPARRGAPPLPIPNAAAARLMAIAAACNPVRQDG
jgi:hypothetical protein